MGFVETTAFFLISSLASCPFRPKVVPETKTFVKQIYLSCIVKHSFVRLEVQLVVLLNLEDQVQILLGHRGVICGDGGAVMYITKLRNFENNLKSTIYVLARSLKG